MQKIYFDNSATTELCPEAKAAMTRAMDIYGNPSSLHAEGLEAEKIIKEARLNISSALGVRTTRDAQLVFTSCGSEANNLALFGVAHAKQRRTANKIITTDSEHPSVEKPLEALAADGFDIVRISTRGGALDMEQLMFEAKENVFMASIMMVNNETGAVYDVAKALKYVKKINPNAVTHCDAVQGFLKVPFTPASIGADLVTVSAHKIHGPKGVGALYISPEIIKAKKIIPWLLGGGQEHGFRSGTENTVGIAGFGAAAEVGFSSFKSDIAQMIRVRDYIAAHLPEEIKINIPFGERAPHILNITLPQIKSETMLHFLSARGICVSSGSACSSHSHSPSRALTAFGLDAFSADCSIRISLNAKNTEADAEALCSALSEGIKSIVKIRR